jgi:hypothetical protein
LLIHWKSLFLFVILSMRRSFCIILDQGQKVCLCRAPAAPPRLKKSPFVKRQSRRCRYAHTHRAAHQHSFFPAVAGTWPYDLPVICTISLTQPVQWLTRGAQDM